MFRVLFFIPTAYQAGVDTFREQHQDIFRLCTNFRGLCVRPLPY